MGTFASWAGVGSFHIEGSPPFAGSGDAVSGFPKQLYAFPDGFDAAVEFVKHLPALQPVPGLGHSQDQHVEPNGSQHELCQELLAGVGVSEALHQLLDESFHYVLGVFWLCHESLPLEKRKGEGLLLRSSLLA